MCWKEITTYIFTKKKHRETYLSASYLQIWLKPESEVFQEKMESTCIVVVLNLKDKIYEYMIGTSKFNFKR